jgi:hypothetical protein
VAEEAPAACAEHSGVQECVKFQLLRDGFVISQRGRAVRAEGGFHCIGTYFVTWRRATTSNKGYYGRGGEVCQKLFYRMLLVYLGGPTEVDDCSTRNSCVGTDRERMQLCLQDKPSLHIEVMFETGLDGTVDLCRID